MLKRMGLFLLLIFLLVSCRTVDDPRNQASRLVIIEITDSGCKPVEIIVPEGESIQVQINNLTSQDFSWYILFFDLEGKFDPSDTKNQIAKISAPSQTLTSAEFSAPKITAKYETVCSPDSDPQQINLINLLVVEPYQSKK